MAKHNDKSTTSMAGSSFLFRGPDPGLEIIASSPTDVKVKTPGKILIEDKDGNEYDVLEFMKTISERLCVLQPNFEAMEKYPALKEAYEHYKLLEDLLLNGDKNVKST